MPKCPKCAGLLVEREDGLYQCDGCGKVFKKKAPTTPPVQAVKADASDDCEKSFAAPTDEKTVERNKITHDEVTEKAKLSQQEEIAELRARLARLEKETDGGDAVKKQPSAVLTFVKNRGKSVLFVLLILIAFVTLMTCFCGLRGIYVNVDDPDEFFSFNATGYEWYYKLDGEQVLDKGKWSKSGNSLTLKYEDEWFGEVEESYQLKDFSWSSFTLYDSFFEEDKKFERVSVIGYKDSNKKATVTFYSNGGVGGGTHSLKIGSVLSSDETPTREGYLFMGWYTTPDGWKTGDGERFADNCRVWKDATYYANWKNAAQFTIRGDNLEQPLSFMENDNVENIFRSSLGWNTLPTGVLGVEFFDDEGNKVNSSAAPAANITARVIYDATVNNGTLTYVNPALTSYTVPSDVSHIAATAFANSKQLEKLYIAERQSELTVASGAFDACGKLDTVSGYAAKGMRAVVDACAGIKNLIVSDGVITTRTFENCSGLLSVTVGSGVTAVGDRAFTDCTGLREIVWNTGLSSNLGQNIFANAGNGGAGVTVYFGGNATRAFNFFETTTSSQSPNITAVVIGDNVTSIGYEAFRDCSSLRSVTIGDSVTSIEAYAFDGCSGLTSVTIGNGVTSIEWYAFYGCSGLTSITIPDSVTSIGEWAFYGCSGLTSITIPDSVTSIGNSAFLGCSGLTSVYYTEDVAGWCGISFGDSYANPLYDAGNLYVGGSLVTDLVIPDSVTNIGSYAFNGCSGLTSITIPDSVTSIGDYAFAYCSGLTSITIPDSVTSIEDYAFRNCSGLTSITIPDSVTSIGSSAFEDCSGLTSVTIGNGVTSIGDRVFYGCSNLTSITIPDSVTSIGELAFYSCSGLTSITIPDSVTSIGEGAFRGCSGLTSVTIGNSVTSIGRYAFYGCSGLTSIHYTGDMQSWLGKDWHSRIMSSGRTLYIDGEKVEGAIVIPDGVQSVPSYAFRGQSGITSVVIPDSVTSIGEGAFWGCTGLTSIAIPDSVTSIGSAAFDGCSGLTSITIPDSVTSIGSHAFYGCSGLTSVTIPDSVTSIGDRVFYGCSNLTSVTMGNSVTSIGDRTFYGCNSLTTISYTGDMQSWLGKNWHDEIMSSGRTLYIDGNKVEGAIVIPDGITSIPSYAFAYQTGITSITIPDSVTSIGSAAFDGCSGLTSVTIGSGVTSIGSGAFSDCYKLVEVYNKSNLSIVAGSSGNGYVAYYAKNVYKQESGSKLTTDENGFVFYYDDTTGYLVGYTGSNKKLVLPDGFIAYDGTRVNAYAIYQYAFSGCRGLTSITIPASVTSIGRYAFSGCSGLTYVTIGNSVTSIGNYAFSGCSGLTSVTIGSGVTSIGSDAFSDCYKLVEVYNKSNLRIVAGSSGNGYVAYYAKNVYKQESGSKLTTDENGFVFYYDGTTGYLVGYTGDKTKLVLPEGFVAYNGVWVNAYEINRYAFYGCSGLTSITIPDSVTSIGRYAFSGCSGLTSVTIGDSVTSIGRYAFSGCSGLTSITIPDSVTSIGERTFYGCRGLTSITIPDSVTSIGEWAFYGCSGLTSITIPDSVTSIRELAFYGCSGLTSVTIGNGVTSIGNYAFSGCSGLTSVTIGSGVTSIVSGAFSGCSGLTSITIPDSVTSIGRYAFSGCSGLTSVFFRNKSGWQVSKSSSFSSYTGLSSSDLSDHSTAATYLKSTYEDYYWRKV